MKNGSGLCNPVYVDDVVDAILLAAVNDKAMGEDFLISSAEAITWKRFYDRFAQMLNPAEIEIISEHEWKQMKQPRFVKEFAKHVLSDSRMYGLLRGSAEGSWLWTHVRPHVSDSIVSLLKGKKKKDATVKSPGATTAATARKSKPQNGTAIGWWDPFMERFFSTKTQVSIEKAKRLLGYEPKYDFDSGMKLTEKWARWANLL